MMLAGDSEENDEKIQAFRAAQLHTRQAQKFHEKANSLEELLNLQSLHANVHIMPAYFTLLQEEIHKLLGNAKEEVAIIYLCFPVYQLYDPPIPLHMFQTHLNFSVEEVYESADYLNNGKIDKLEEDIANFLQFIREKFPDMMITPRLHTLEEHVCPFLQQWIPW
ncbi:hypothetical protein pdam_00014336 [Pocillopora damicornis]|uniref:Uncharacterized protein n=1 Tax=Pocillopora damicornis TaxID=46731 RepID=A0A3M6TG96_POCDA|nr:hypothetical protein pdam_00014336 [Pocillopora damicornis]